MRENKPTRKSNVVYFQIGLIAALLLTIFVIENKTELKNLKPEAAHARELDAETPFVFHMPKEKPKVKQPVKENKTSKKLPTQPMEKPFVEPAIVEAFESNDPVNYDPGKIEFEQPIDKPIENIDFRKVEMAPVFPGCEIYETQEEIKSCFSSQIAKIIKKKFDGDLAAELNLRGEQRIYVTFTVNDKGWVENIKTRSIHDELSNEAERVVKLLPKMQPGQQQDKKVSVRYSLPIIFHIK